MSFFSSIGSGISSAFGTSASFVGPPTATQSVFNSIGSGLDAVGQIASPLAGLATSVVSAGGAGMQTAASINQRTEEFKAQLEADTKANILAIEADADAKIAADIEANALMDDAIAAAQQERILAISAESTQRMAYRKSGVLLEGSPLVVLDQTWQKGQENSRNILSSAARQAEVIRKRGEIKTPMINRTSLSVLNAANKADLAKGTVDTLNNLKQLV